MTASLWTAARLPEGATDVGQPSLFRAWTSSFLVYFYPGVASRVWLSISPARAAIVAGINLVLMAAWGVLVVASRNAWDRHLLRHVNYLGEYVDAPASRFLQVIGALPGQMWEGYSELQLVDQLAIVVAAIMLTATFLAMQFFLLMPFAARPGANRPCVQHVLRTVLLGTGFVHIWSPVVAATFVLFIVYRYPPGLENIIAPLLVVLMSLVAWALAGLIFAARREYRRRGDYPQAHDPTCDRCGYNLVASDPAGRCPECGKPVAESLGPQVRLPTPWERRPTLLNVKAIGRQLAQLVRRPQELFVSMPTLTGQSAAHRWLAGALVVVGAAAFFIVPAFNFFQLSEIDWTNSVAGGVAVGMVWSILALMMVGIETAGIATFSRMKGHPVSLGTAAKVTAYSAPLMLPWVFMGGAQLLGIYWWNESYFVHYGLRTNQVIMMGSLTLAHIGGLLWYELTVYRGIRGVQWANR